MDNLCLYKIKVKGSRLACKKLLEMMPIFQGEKETILEEGSNDDYTLVFSGNCEVDINYNTDDFGIIESFSEEEIEGEDYFEFSLEDKALLLGVEIFCNTKNMYNVEQFYHYNKDFEILGESPEDLLKF